MKHIFSKAKPLLEKIEASGHQAYFVGGCVRDLFIGRPIGDVDIATSATPEQIQQIFPKVIPVGIEHGTVIVRWENESYEVTTFRVEGAYSDKRHPDNVEFVSDVEKDLERRDFTINALAMDLEGKLIDLFCGKEDIIARKIRTVGNGYERFKEDPLRIIRALRFSSQLGFEIHPETLEQMVAVGPEIQTLAVERITSEFTKLFAGTHVNNGLKYLRKLGLTKYLPIFSEHPRLLRDIPEIGPMETFGEVIAFLHRLHTEINIQHWVKVWKCSNRTKKEAEQLAQAVDHFMRKGIDRELVYRLDYELFDGFLRVLKNLVPEADANEAGLTEAYRQLAIHSRHELTIDGHQLMDLFPDRPRGPWMKTMLNAIETEVVAGRLKNDYNDIRDWLKWNPPAES